MSSPKHLNWKETSMRSKATLLTTAAALAIGFAVPAYAQSTEAPGAKSDITIAADTTPSTSGVENSAAGEGASNMNTPDVPATTPVAPMPAVRTPRTKAAPASRAAPRAKAPPTRIAQSIRRAAQALRRPAAIRPDLNQAPASRIARKVRAPLRSRASPT